MSTNLKNVFHLELAQASAQNAAARAINQAGTAQTSQDSRPSRCDKRCASLRPVPALQRSRQGATPPQRCAMDSYYAMLKVTRDSKFPEDVTKSYRKLALRAHPDKGGSKEEAFDALHRAYEVLKDEEKRKVYDRFGFDFGDDESADELLGELSPMAMRLIGIAIFRAALCGAVVVGLRYRVPRTLCIAACGGCVVYGQYEVRSGL